VASCFIATYVVSSNWHVTSNSNLGCLSHIQNSNSLPFETNVCVCECERKTGRLEVVSAFSTYDDS
jgi:hypothetical protein